MVLLSGFVVLKAGPQGKGAGSAGDPIENPADFGDKLDAEAGPAFVVPKSCRAEFLARLRMKNDAHAAAPTL
jgi:hypothetical protein